MDCPKCGEECWRDDVDVGVGIIYGPYGCPGCGWSEDREYDHSNGVAPAQTEHPDWYVTQWGQMVHKDRLREGAARFGIDPTVIDEVFP